MVYQSLSSKGTQKILFLALDYIGAFRSLQLFFLNKNIVDKVLKFKKFCDERKKYKATFLKETFC